jgi:hypothetical protein
VTYALVTAISADDRLPPNDQSVAKGLRLYETLVAG